MAGTLLFHLLILALWTWRLTVMVNEEEGPMGVFTRLRNACGVLTYLKPYTLDVVVEETQEKVERLFWMPEPLPAYAQPTLLARGVRCPYCASVWIGAAIALAFFVAPATTIWLAYPFALSAIAMAFQEAVGQ